MDENEDPAHALTRETMEEMGRSIANLELIAEVDCSFVRNCDGVTEAQRNYVYQMHLVPVLQENLQQSCEAGTSFEW